jgi:hypothetical protein
MIFIVNLIAENIIRRLNTVNSACRRPKTAKVIEEGRCGGDERRSGRSLIAADIICENDRTCPTK